MGEEINRDSKGETVETGSRATRRSDSQRIGRGRVGRRVGRPGSFVSFVGKMVVNQNVDDRSTKVNRIAQEKTRGKDYDFVVVVTCQEDDEEAEKNQREKPKEERNAISTIPAKPKRKTKKGGRGTEGTLGETHVSRDRFLFPLGRYAVWMAFRLGERTCCSIVAGLPRDGLSKSPGSDGSSRVVYAETFVWWYIYGAI